MARTKKPKLPRLQRDESMLESHRECCGWRPVGEHCGVTTWNDEDVCTRPAGHEGKHYDALLCTSFTPGAVMFRYRPAPSTKPGGEG